MRCKYTNEASKRDLTAAPHVDDLLVVPTSYRAFYPNADEIMKQRSMMVLVYSRKRYGCLAVELAFSTCASGV